MTLSLEIKSLPARRLAAISHTGPYPALGPKFSDLGHMWQEGEIDARAAVGVFHDNPAVVPMAQLRSHAALEIAPDAAIPAKLEEVVLEPGRYAVVQHKGPYEELEDTYGWLYANGMPEAGVMPSGGPVTETYLNNPAVTAPRDLITEIAVPLT